MERQLARWRGALASGMPRRGWKVGINVPAVQARVGLAHALLGWIDGRRVHASGASLEPDPASKWHVEPELAIRLARTVDPAAGEDAAAACVANVAPALEIVDYALPADDLETVIEHSMFHAGCVLGASRPADAAAELGVRWPVLKVGERIGPAPRADLVPARLGALLHFAAELLAGFGEELRAGDLLLSGSYAERAVTLAPHSEAVADFGRLGRVRVAIL
jgi:2-keto-4-pentenoate hydratase